MKNIFKKVIVKILIWESKLVLKKYKPKIIAITGSVGKTSTKDAVFIVLSKFKKVRKSEKSFNSEIGLPLTILGLSNAWSSPVAWLENIVRGLLLLVGKHDYPEYLILEVGVGKPGDIKKYVAPWLHPDVVVVTRFPERPVHVEFFKGLDDIIEEKSALAYALKKDGLLILNHDDEKVFNLHEKVGRKTVSYGENENATYRGIYPNYLEENGKIKGMNFKLLYEGNTFPVNLPHVLGLHYMSSALIAIACAKELGCDLLSSISYISEYKNPAGRLSIIEGVNNSTIIDDTYNSSPVALEAALGVLKELKAKRKIAVLGDMMELGKYTEEEHRKIGKDILGVLDIIVTVGPRAKFIADEAIENKFKVKDVYSFDNSGTVAKFLEGIVEEGDLILIKGSQSTRLERAVKAIMAHPEEAKNLLCRQEKEWEAKK